MFRRLALLCAAATATACSPDTTGQPEAADPPCVRFCKDARDKLINNFGVPPEQIDCSERKWVEADTCSKCDEIVRRDYRAQPTELCQTYYE